VRLTIEAVYTADNRVNTVLFLLHTAVATLKVTDDAIVAHLWRNYGEIGAWCCRTQNPNVLQCKVTRNLVE